MARCKDFPLIGEAFSFFADKYKMVLCRGLALPGF